MLFVSCVCVRIGGVVLCRCVCVRDLLIILRQSWECSREALRVCVVSSQCPTYIPIHRVLFLPSTYHS